MFLDSVVSRRQFLFLPRKNFSVLFFIVFFYIWDYLAIHDSMEIISFFLNMAGSLNVLEIVTLEISYLKMRPDKNQKEIKKGQKKQDNKKTLI